LALSLVLSSSLHDALPITPGNLIFSSSPPHSLLSTAFRPAASAFCFLSSSAGPPVQLPSSSSSAGPPVRVPSSSSPVSDPSALIDMPSVACAGAATDHTRPAARTVSTIWIARRNFVLLWCIGILLPRWPQKLDRFRPPL